MIVIIRSLVMIIIQAVEPVGGGGGGGGATFSRHFCLETMNLSILPVCNSHLSVLSQKKFNMLVSLLLSLKSTVFACCPSYHHFHRCVTTN